jgi:hypothetical protein
MWQTLRQHSYLHTLYYKLVYFYLLTQDQSQSTKGRNWADTTDVGHWTSPPIYILVSWRPLNGRAKTDGCAIIEETCRVTFLLYMAPIWRRFGAYPVRTDLEASCIYLTQFASSEWADSRRLRLWALLMASLEATKCDHQEAGVEPYLVRLLTTKFYRESPHLVRYDLKPSF